MRKTWMTATGLVLAAGGAAALVGMNGLQGAGSGHVSPATRSLASAIASGEVGAKIDPAGAGIITTVAGNGSLGSTGDGGPATQASVSAWNVVADPSGNLYLLHDTYLRRVTAAGTINRFTGSDDSVFTPRGQTPVGDGGPAIQARFGTISGVATDTAGNVYVSDASNFRVRRIGTDGIIRTIAGAGEPGPVCCAVQFTGEGGPALQATLSRPGRLAVDRAGNIFFLDNGFIRRIAANGVITTIAGTGPGTSTGDGGPATQAGIAGATTLATDAAGNVYLDDLDTGAIRRISTDGIITTVAGGGMFRVDPLSINSEFQGLEGFTVDPQGNILVLGRDLVHRTNPAGVLDVVVGKRLPGSGLIADSGFAGDGGPATSALLDQASGAWTGEGTGNVTSDGAGNLYIADRGNNRIRKVTPAQPAPSPVAMGAFAAGVEVRLDKPHTEIVIADVTGDRRSDLVVVVDAVEDDYQSPQPDQLQVLVQKADGTLAAPVRAVLPRETASIQAADLNRDGRQDLVVSGDQVAVALGTTTGAMLFNALPRRWRDSRPFNPRLLDTNRDGLLDIVVSESTAGMGGSIYLGAGNGSFAAPQKLMSPLTLGSPFETADFTADGLADLVAYSYQTPSPAWLLLQQGDNRFNAAQTIPGEPADHATAVGDWNGDGRLDFVYPQYWLLQFLWQGGNGRLGAPAWRLIEDVPHDLLSTDIDGDGLDDLLTGHSGAGGFGVLLQRNGKLEEDLKFPMPAGFEEVLPYGIGRVAAGDLNGDGCKDVVAREGGSSLYLYLATRCRPPQIARDLDGDGRADIVWRNINTGANDLWRSADVATRVPLTAMANLDWKLVGIGDFDGDGKADLLWRNATTGANDLWRSGSAVLRQPIASEPSQAWKVAGIGDFNNDGRDDIFWRNAATGQNGVWWSANRATSQSAQAWPDANWQVAGVADFTGDAKDDVLWRNSATGANELWPSASHAQRRAVTAVTSLPWKIAGVADFNGDGDADILWRHAATGANTIWLFGKATTQRAVTTVADVNWEVASTADYDGDGKADILWRHKLTGGNELWSEANVKFRKVLPAVGTQWTVAGR